MKRRGAIDLSINMIVMIIISLAILTGGIILLNKFITGADEIKASLDQKTDERLNDLLVDQGKKVALPFHTATILRGDSHTFGIGILNVGGVGSKFRINVEFVKLIAPDGSDRTTEALNIASWSRFDRNELTVEEGEHLKKTILILVPKDALPGQYVFTARIFLPNGEIYGNRQDFFVTVP
ncbi:MAG TPA: hypothetical protein VJI98_00755 [Candidatus Nanoarchaeia archaeon]|nr:hypothetical protein [Candidatus Nanoarchaeia archaeon]